MSDLVKEFNKQRGLLDWFDGRLKKQIPSTESTDIYLICYDLAIEHHTAILLLYESELLGSMFALLRVQLEALVRGQYLHHCASDEELSRFRNDKDIGKNIGEMISAFEKKVGHQQGVLSKLKNDAYDFMNSLTHTGFQHLTRRMTEGGEVGSVNYTDQEKLQALKISGFLASLAYVGVADLSDDKNFMAEYRQKLTELS